MNERAVTVAHIMAPPAHVANPIHHERRQLAGSVALIWGAGGGTSTPAVAGWATWVDTGALYRACARDSAPEAPRYGLPASMRGSPALSICRVRCDPRTMSTKFHP
jgi:hypothetical protein